MIVFAFAFLVRFVMDVIVIIGMIEHKEEEFADITGDHVHKDGLALWS